MKQIIKVMKEKEIDIVMLLIIIGIIMSFYKALEPNDELWNFANIYKMNLGYTIYQDLNVIITPLFFRLGQVFLILFGNNYVGFRIYNVAIYTTMFMLIYNIFKQFKINKEKNIIYLLIICAIFGRMISAGANYNILAMIPILVTVLLLMNKKENPYLLGALVTISFWTKQNIGIYFMVGVVLYQIVEKKSLKNIVKTILTIVVTSLMVVFIMIKQGTLNGLINYAFAGINEFGARNKFLNENGILYLLLFVWISGFAIFILKNKKIHITEDINRYIKILACIGTPLLMIAYPIVNRYHVVLGGLLLMIELIAIIDTILISEMFTNRKTEKILSIIAICLYLIGSLLYSNLYIKNKGIHMQYDKYSPYYGVLSSLRTKEDIEHMSQFIYNNQQEGIDIKIVSCKANLYMVPMKQNNRVLDLPLLGNLGQAGEEGVIQEIKKWKHTKILVEHKEENLFYQESKKIRNYIQQNYEKQGEIENFDIYLIP